MRRSARDRSASPLSRPIDLAAAWNATDAEVADRFEPAYRAALGRMPGGDQVFRGLRFSLGSSAAGRRWLLLDREISIRLPSRSTASHVVVAHFSDSWRDADGLRPAGMPVGWVLPIGEPLARYEVVLADGRVRAVDVRRRYEIDDGIIGWGSVAFAAVDHRPDGPLDWRGPHPRQAPGRYAAAGHAGPLTMLPGTWAGDQSGVTDHVPSADGDAVYWLHAIALGPRATPVELRLAPLGGGRPGTDVVVAAVTLFDGTADPLVLEPRRQLLVEGLAPGLAEVDLGIAIRSRATNRPQPDPPAIPTGWGGAGDASGDARTVVDVATAPDARLWFGTWEVAIAELADGPIGDPTRSARITPLPAPDVRVEVHVTAEGSDAGTEARVRFVAPDGRYLPPVGHRDEVNPGLCEDTGADVLLGGREYAYVPPSFEVQLPVGPVDVEVVKGFEYRPVRTVVEVDRGTRRIDLALQRPIDLRPEGWLTADSHVHYLAPSTALLQAAGEDIGLVHLLATQWGDHMTNVTDLPWGSIADPTGAHAVVMGTENRQNVLGHVGLLGARRPILPMASGGGPEGRIGQAVTELLADWADRCHAAGGIAVASHFPLPYAEVAADIVAGRIDAVEMQCFAPGLDSPPILEWYRFLGCGYRVPVLGGTDKMSAEVPVGAVRTYARLRPGDAPTGDAWADAVRAGRTFATSGPVIELTVDGHGPGEVIELPASGGHVSVRASARASQPIVSAVEIVVNGAVVASEGSAAATERLDVDARIAIRAGSWIAARARSPFEVRSGFATSMAAHSSPVYLDVRDHPITADDDARAILAVIEGTLRWIGTMATVATEDDRRRMLEVVEGSAGALRARRASWHGRIG